MSQQPPLNLAPDPFKGLPPEVLRLIISQFCAHCCGEYEQPFEVHFSVQDTTALYNLCLVSRRLRNVSQEIMFHYFGARSISSRLVGNGWKWQLGPFLRTVAARPDLARSVKVASLHWLLFCRMDFDESKNIFDKCAKSLGTSAFSVFLGSRSDQDSPTNKIRESFLLRGPVPKGVGQEEYCPVVASELLAIMLAILPQVFYLGVIEDAGFIGNARGWDLDVSVPTLDAIGANALALKTLESDYGMPDLLSRAKNLETFVTCGHGRGCVSFKGQNDACSPALPSLKRLHILRLGKLGPITGILRGFTGQLTTFSYTAAEPDILTLVQCLDRPRFRKTLESMRLDLRCMPGAEIQPMASLKLFTKLRTLFLPGRPIYGCDASDFEPQSLIDILPPNIESLTIVDYGLPTASRYRLYLDLLRLLNIKERLFPKLKSITSDSDRFSDPVLRGLFEQAGVVLIHEGLPRYQRKFTGQMVDYENEYKAWSPEGLMPLPHEMSPDPDL